MSAWRIRVPYRSRGDDLADVALASRAIGDAEEHTVAYQLAVDAAISGGMRTAGELVDSLGSMTKTQRRQLLDRTREAVGLQSATDADAHRAFEMAQLLARRRVPSTEPPVLSGGGWFVIPPSEAELAAAQREDELRLQENRARAEQRKHDAAERRATREARAERWKPRRAGWEPPRMTTLQLERPPSTCREEAANPIRDRRLHGR